MARPTLRARARRRAADDRLALLRAVALTISRSPVAGSLTVELITISCSGTAIAAELDRQPLEMLGPAQRLGLRAREQRHRVEAVEDPPGQPDRPRELVVEMDRVEVAGGAGVADRGVAVGRDRSSASSSPGSGARSRPRPHDLGPGAAADQLAALVASSATRIT
jgi:hypothetical protein